MDIIFALFIHNDSIAEAVVVVVSERVVAEFGVDAESEVGAVVAEFGVWVWGSLLRCRWVYVKPVKIVLN